MKIRLKTQTPVHIGTGIRYGPGEFFVRPPTVCRVSTERLYRALSEGRRKAFLWEVEARDFKLNRFLNEGEHEEIDRYALNNTNLVSVPNVKEIRECIKTGFDEPYIPGSSIKGSIRTALLWDVARNDPSFVETIKKDPRSDNKKVKGSIGKTYEGRIFSTKTKNGESDDDPKYDLLKFLQVSDAHAIPTARGPKQKLRLDGIQTFSLTENGFYTKVMTYAETVMGEYECEITLAPAIRGALDSSDLNILEDRLPVLGITARDLDDLPAAEEKVFAHIKGAMRRFVDAALAKERRLVDRGKNEKCDRGLQKIEAEHRTTDLFRIGFGVGTTYQTLFDIIEEKDQDLAQDIVNNMKIGKYDRYLSGDALDPPYPKTIEFTLKFSPMGWVQW